MYGQYKYLNGCKLKQVVKVISHKTDRQTDHATRCLTIDRIYVRSTAMRSKNEIKLFFRLQKFH